MMIAEKQDLELAARERRALFTHLYKAVFPSVSRFIRQHNGSTEDARDIFQDALVIFYEKLQEGGAGPGSKEAYLAGIAKNLWFRKTGKETATFAIEGMEELAAPDERPEDKHTGSLLNMLETAGKKCLDLLSAFYYHRQPASKIMRQFGYGSIRSATVQKFKCLEKLREHVKEKQLFYEDFTH